MDTIEQLTDDYAKALAEEAAAPSDEQAERWRERADAAREALERARDDQHRQTARQRGRDLLEQERAAQERREALEQARARRTQHREALRETVEEVEEVAEALLPMLGEAMTATAGLTPREQRAVRRELRACLMRLGAEVDPSEFRRPTYKDDPLWPKGTGLADRLVAVLDDER